MRWDWVTTGALVKPWAQLSPAGKKPEEFVGLGSLATINEIFLYKRAGDESKEKGNPFNIYRYVGRTAEVIGYQAEEAQNG